MAQKRYNIRVNEPLANHIEAMCGEDGFYENASEYFRDLARHDFERIEEEKIRRINEVLEPLLGRPVEECEPFDPEKDLEEIERQYLAEKESQK